MYRGIHNRRSRSFHRRFDDSGIPSRTVLPFSSLIFVNASERYILANGSMSGPFAAGTPATRVIGGKKYVQLERAFSTLNTHSESPINYMGANKERINPFDNVIASPIGTLTAGRIEDSSDLSSGWHFGYQLLNLESDRIYKFSCVAKADEKTQLVLQFGNMTDPSKAVAFDLVTGAAFQTDGIALPNSYGMEQLADGWCYCWMLMYSTHADLNVHADVLLRDAGSIIYVGTEGEGLYVWGINVIYTISPRTSYIKAGASPTVKTADEGYFATSIVPAWLYDEGFRLRVIPYHTRSGVSNFAWYGDAIIAEIVTPAETIKIKFSSVSPYDTLVIQGSVSGVFLSVSGLDWSVGAMLEMAFEWNVSGVSRLTLSGFTSGNGTYTGLPITVGSGNVYLGMNSGFASYLDGMFGEPEKF